LFLGIAIVLFVNAIPNNLPSHFWGFYEVGFPEDAYVKLPGEF
jgi:hypothetical protein